MKLVSAIVLCLMAAIAQGQVVNGDFEAGNNSFGSQYPYNEAGLEGSYVVTSQPQLWNPQFAPTPDHTSGTGNMLVVNPNSPTSYFWQQTVEVTPSTSYEFSAWVSSAFWASPAVLRLQVNGVTLGSDFLAPATTGTWVNWDRVWTSETNSLADIRLYNVNPDTFGNDFYLDDLTFTALSEPPLAGLDLYVGSNSSSVTVQLPSGTSTYRNAFVGAGASATNNSLEVLSAGTLLNLTGSAFIGDQGSGNRLTISNGGIVIVSSNVVVGNSPLAQNNEILVSGAGSELEAVGFGMGGAFNRVRVEDGGRLMTGGTNAGSWPAVVFEGSSNEVVVRGAGSEWVSTVPVYVNAAGGVFFSVEGGGSVVLSNYGEFSAINHGLWVSGAGSEFEAGYGTLNGWTQVLDGGRVSFSGEHRGAVSPEPWAPFGQVILSYGSHLEVSGSGSRFEAGGMVSGILTNTWWTNEPTNTIRVSAGGALVTESFNVVTNGSGDIQDYWQGRGTSVEVSGVGSAWTNAGTVAFGSGSNNTLRILDGGRVASGVVTVGDDWTGSGNNINNEILVSGAGSELVASTVSLMGVSNSLTVAEAAMLSADLLVADGTGVRIHVGRLGGAESGGLLNVAQILLGADAFLSLNQTNHVEIAASIAGTGGGIRQTGIGRSTFTGLTGSNSLVGALQILAGTVELAGGSNSMAREIQTVEVAPSATLLVSNSDQVNDAASVTLSGGSIVRGSGVSETFGALQVTSESVLDFGTGAGGIVAFGSYSMGSERLLVDNFLLGNTLRFGTNLSTLLPASYAGMMFENGSFAIRSLSGGFTTAWSPETSVFSITAIPEPRLTFVALGLVALCGGAELMRRRRRLRERSQ